MGIFKSVQKGEAEVLYEKIKENLAEKDGLTHVIMINSFARELNDAFCCETKYTVQIDSILNQMQKDGYEILDVKFQSVESFLYKKGKEAYRTLIVYK